MPSNGLLRNSSVLTVPSAEKSNCAPIVGTGYGKTVSKESLDAGVMISTIGPDLVGVATILVVAVAVWVGTVDCIRVGGCGTQLLSRRSKIKPEPHINNRVFKNPPFELITPNASFLFF